MLPKIKRSRGYVSVVPINRDAYNASDQTRWHPPGGFLMAVHSITGQIRSAWTWLFLLAYAIVDRFPLVLRLSTHAYWEGGDYYFFTWALAWQCHAIAQGDFAHYWATNAMHPYPYALAFTENMMGLVPVACPLWWLTRNPILTMNATVLLLIGLTAIGAYAAIRRLVDGDLGALAGAMVFAFYPYLLWHGALGNAHVFAIAAVPWIIYANVRFWHTGCVRFLLLMAALWWWAFASSLYIGIYLTVFMLLWNGLWLWIERDRFPRRRIVQWGIAVAAVWVAMAPVLSIYYRISVDMNASRTLDHVVRYTGYAWSWLTPTQHHWLWAQRLSFLPRPRFIAEHDAMFPGFIGLLLLTLGWVVWGMPPWLRSLKWTGVITAILAVGPYPLGLPWRIPLPFIGLWYLFPPIWATRNPHRFALFTMVVTGFTTAFLLQRFSLRRWWGRGRDWFLIAVLSLDLWTYGMPREVLHPGAAAFFRSLRFEQPVTLVHLPMPDVWLRWVRETEMLVGSTYHWNRIVNGITGLWPPVQFQLGRELTEFPTSHTLRLLQALDVDVIVVDERFISDEQRQRLGRWAPTMQLIRRQGPLSLWRLAPGPRRRVFHFATDLRLRGPSRGVAGPVTLSLEVVGACEGVVFNPQAPARWKMPVYRPWRIWVGLEDIPLRGAWLEWYAPALFHPRNCRMPISLTIPSGTHALLVTIRGGGQWVKLRHPIEVVREREDVVSPLPFFRLAEGFAPQPLEAVIAEIRGFFPDRKDVVPGNVFEGDVMVRNPGPYYWTGGSTGVQIGVLLLCGKTRQVFAFPLPHDLFPGDQVTQHVAIPLPNAIEACRLEVNLFGRTGDSIWWFPAANTITVWHYSERR